MLACMLNSPTFSGDCIIMLRRQPWRVHRSDVHAKGRQSKRGAPQKTAILMHVQAGCNRRARRQNRHRGSAWRSLHVDDEPDDELGLEDVDEDSSPERGDAAAAGSSSGSSSSQHCLQRVVYISGRSSSGPTHSNAW